jgi:hypothetical protein
MTLALQFLGAARHVTGTKHLLHVGDERDQSTAKVQAYMKTHPKTKADLTAIRQPLTDIKNRCAATP